MATIIDRTTSLGFSADGESRLKDGRLATRSPLIELFYFSKTAIVSDNGAAFHFEIRTPLGMPGMNCYRILGRSAEGYVGQLDATIRHADHPLCEKQQGWGMMDYRFITRVPEGGSLHFVPSINSAKPAIEVSEKQRTGFSGIGRTLLELAMGVAREWGADIFIIDAVSAETEDFYKKVGFEKRPLKIFGEEKLVLAYNLSQLCDTMRLEIKTRYSGTGNP